MGAHIYTPEPGLYPLGRGIGAVPLERDGMPAGEVLVMEPGAMYLGTFARPHHIIVENGLTRPDLTNPTRNGAVTIEHLVGRGILTVMPTDDKGKSIDFGLFRTGVDAADDNRFMRLGADATRSFHLTAGAEGLVVALTNPEDPTAHVVTNFTPAYLMATRPPVGTAS